MAFPFQSQVSVGPYHFGGTMTNILRTVYGKQDGHLLIAGVQV